jgi:hypothetical protein
MIIALDWFLGRRSAINAQLDFGAQIWRKSISDAGAQRCADCAIGTTAAA